jgi:hypothetical protein
MNANENVEKHPPTKLIFFYSNCDQSCDIRERLTSIPTLVQRLGYTFQFEMPSVKVERREKKLTPIYLANCVNEKSTMIVIVVTSCNSQRNYPMKNCSSGEFSNLDT